MIRSLLNGKHKNYEIRMSETVNETVSLTPSFGHIILYSFIDGSAFCPGPPKHVPSDSEKHLRV